MSHNFNPTTASIRRVTFSDDLALLNVSGEKGNGAGNYDGESEPNDTFKRPAKPILSAHRDYRVNDAG